MQLQSAKCLVGNSIIDGLKSRLMQYLKHVVEDDVLFTKVISKFKPVTVGRGGGPGVGGVGRGGGPGVGGVGGGGVQGGWWIGVAGVKGWVG